MTDEDFDKARVPATQTFEIRRVVAAAEVDDLYWPRLERSASARSYCGNASISARSSRLGRRSC